MIEQDFLLYFLYLPISIGVGIFLMGVVLLWIDSRKQKESIRVRIRDWKETGGKILAVHLDEVSKDEPDLTETEKTFQPVIEYVYNVGSKEYHGNNVFPGKHSDLNQEQAQEFLEKYTLHSYIPVRYNPEEPEKSALERQPFKSNRLRLFGLLFTWFGVAVCCFSTLMIFIMSANIL